MNPIVQAILRDEIRQAINALFKSGQVGRVESTHVILDAELTKNTEFKGSIAGIDPADPNLLEAGKTYTVTTDSGTYKTVCKSPDANTKYIGNAYKLDGDESGTEDTGEPFVGLLVYEDLGNGHAGWFVIFIDFQYGTHVKIVGDETIHPIDKKFIPGVVLPVVELSTTLDIGTEPVNLSAEDCSTMTAVASTGTPIALKYTLNGGVPFFSVASLAVTQVGDAAIYFYGAMSALEGIITIRVLGNPKSGQWQAFVTQG